MDEGAHRNRPTDKHNVDGYEKAEIERQMTTSINSSLPTQIKTWDQEGSNIANDFDTPNF